MKTSMSILFLVALLSQGLAQSVPLERQKTITVYGAGTIERPANRAVISFAVKGFGPSIEEAVLATREKLNSVTTKLFAAGLTPENLVTSTLLSGDNFEGRAFLSSSRDFRTQLSVNVTIDSLGLIDNIIETLAGSQIEQLSNVNFVLKTDSTLKLEARRLATINAKEKAQLIASQLGVSIAGPIEIQELLSPSDGDFYLPPRSDNAQTFNMDRIEYVKSAPMVYYGAQRFTIKAGVRVVFAIRP
jgi:uncharacterized protein YggE